MSMKLTVNQWLEQGETEIIVNCSVIDKRLARLMDYIRQYAFSLEAFWEGECFQVPLEEVLYFDSVDGRTFLYTTHRVYQSRQTLLSLEQMLQNTPFLRIGKSCILNTGCLKSVKPVFNHRLEATLVNDEKLIVSRSCIDALKEKLQN